MELVLPPLEVIFMDIGRNDGIVIQCDGEYAFIDSGVYGKGVKAATYMKGLGITRLKYYIGTHAHKDHVEGASAILAAFDVDEVIVSHEGTAKLIRQSATNSIEEAAVREAEYRVVKAGQVFSLGSAEFLVLGPIKIVRAGFRDDAENSNSLVLRLTYGESTFLFTGDATRTELKQIEQANPGCLRAQVIKNPHHDNLQRYLVKCGKPLITVFSTGKDSLPSSEFLRFLKKEGSSWYITAPNRDGNVMISSDGKKLKVTTRN